MCWHSLGYDVGNPYTHDDAHGAFMTLPPYTSTSKDEVHHLSCGPQSCRVGL